MIDPPTQSDVVTINDVHYIRATSALVDDRVRTLKFGETFAVLSRFGDIEAIGPVPLGLFHAEMRHLSRLVFMIDNRQPLPLASFVRDDSSVLCVDVSNVDGLMSEGKRLPGGILHGFRRIMIGSHLCHQVIRLANYWRESIQVRVSFQFDTDFADIFQVRGNHREKTGERLPPLAEGSMVTFSYRGLDRIDRQTVLEFSRRPDSLSASAAEFVLSLQTAEESELGLTITCNRTGISERCTPRSSESTTARANVRLHSTRLFSTNQHFDRWLSRSESDLVMLMAGNPEKDYPYAGIPWFSTVFGRDGIITAFECLWLAPQIARGVLRHLAATQATDFNASADAEPGKIVHETRCSEMAVLGEVPFARYYGSVDSTPLFIMLAWAYLQRTNDVEFIRSIWPNLLAALEWMDRYGDLDHDGFIEYQRKSEQGLIQQGWKDSYDSIFGADGTLAEPPIALCEVQAYGYGARRAIAELASVLEFPDKAIQQRNVADKLHTQFNRFFWCEDLSSYVIALDGAKRQCQIRSSNAGHALWTGIATTDRAVALANTLLGNRIFSGWGLRTVGTGEARYNPISYHNGSVWPHDNAIIASGLSNYGLQNASATIFASIYEASLHFDLARLPELYCGFHRRSDSSGPALYPVACAPQAWSAGAVYLLLAACLGIHIDAQRSVVRLKNPTLPHFLMELQIDGLTLGGLTADILLRRQKAGVSVRVIRKSASLNIEYS
jgi:glycogen debranching enzyme